MWFKRRYDVGLADKVELVKAVSEFADYFNFHYEMGNIKMSDDIAIGIADKLSKILNVLKKNKGE